MAKKVKTSLHHNSLTDEIFPMKQKKENDS